MRTCATSPTRTTAPSEERTTTAFVGPNDVLEIDERDDFLVHVGAAT